MNAIEIKNITKSYNLKHTNEKFFFLRDIKEEKFIAINKINLKIKVGECFGIIGENGSGKTTLLRLIGDLTKPEKGDIKINGKILSFLDISAGFQEELTGKENIYLYGSLLGFSRREISKKYNEIISFSQLEKFIDVKLKNYSLGMKVRLAFSIAMSHDPEIVLMDEILSVGDEYFQKKSLNKIKSMRDNGKTIVIVSHDMNLIKELCNRVAWLDAGKIVKIGMPSKVVFDYLTYSAIKKQNKLIGINDKIKQLDNINKKINQLKYKRKGFFDFFTLNKFMLQLEERKKLDLTEDLLNELSYVKNSLLKELEIIENQVELNTKKNIKKLVVSLVVKIISIKEKEIDLVKDDKTKLKLLKNINSLIDKKLIYTNQLEEKFLLYKLRAYFLLKSIRLNNNPFDRSSTIDQLFGISPTINKQISKGDSLYNEIKHTIKKLDIKTSFNTISQLKFTYENITLTWLLSKWIKSNQFKEEDLFSDLSKYLTEASLKNKKIKRTVISFIFLELSDRLRKEYYDITLRAKIILTFYQTLKELRLNFAKSHLETFNSSMVDLFSHMAKNIVMMKQTLLYSNKFYVQNEINEYNKLKKELLFVRGILNREYKYKKNSKIEILDVWLSDEQGNKKEKFHTKDTFTINMKYKTNNKIKNPVFGISIFSEEGFQIIGSNTKKKGFKIKKLNREAVLKYIIKSLPFLKGVYYVTCSIHPYNSLNAYDSYEYCSFFVENKENEEEGTILLESEWKHNS